MHGHHTHCFAGKLFLWNVTLTVLLASLFWSSVQGRRSSRFANKPFLLALRKNAPPAVLLASCFRSSAQERHSCRFAGKLFLRLCARTAPSQFCGQAVSVALCKDVTLAVLLARCFCSSAQTRHSSLYWQVVSVALRKDATLAVLLASCFCSVTQDATLVALLYITAQTELTEMNSNVIHVTRRNIIVKKLKKVMEGDHPGWKGGDHPGWKGGDCTCSIPAFGRNKERCLPINRICTSSVLAKWVQCKIWGVNFGGDRFFFYHSPISK